MVPSGLDEQAIEAAGLVLLKREDRTAATAEVAARLHAARARRAAALEREEGADWFGQRQRLLATTAELAQSRRLSLPTLPRREACLAAHYGQSATTV